jgi:hypothetical protein
MRQYTPEEEALLRKMLPKLIEYVESFTDEILRRENVEQEKQNATYNMEEQKEGR